MNNKLKQLLFAVIAFLLTNCSSHVDKPQKLITSNNEPVAFYLTKADQSVLFQSQLIEREKVQHNNLPTISVSVQTSYQEIDGFGFTLTGGSAELINVMSEPTKASLLQELFGTGKKDIGVSYLRISIGASDLDKMVFSYNDLALGETDILLEQFSIDEDRKNLIPVLKKILAINPNIKILASPWSPPAWMKTNNAPKGGSLKTKYYDVYAQYFIKYIQAMKLEGITIDALTVQNEPLHPGNNPSLYMAAEQQADFIKLSLGPAFESAKIDTKIIIYDHNADRPDYPISVLNDSEANQYIDGSAFHLYGGKIESLSVVHEKHPDKNIYFTEQWIGAPGDFPNDLKFHVKELIIGATRNWSKTVLEWNLAADPDSGPHTKGGCTRCLGAITIDGDIIKRNPAYYIIAHASKFVRPDSVRIESNTSTALPNVAFKTPKNEIVVIVFNNSEGKQQFNIRADNEIIGAELDAGAVGTFIIPK
jgi:glucosylceramidase